MGIYEPIVSSVWLGAARRGDRAFCICRLVWVQRNPSSGGNLACSFGTAAHSTFSAKSGWPVCGRLPLNSPGGLDTHGHCLTRPHALKNANTGEPESNFSPHLRALMRRHGPKSCLGTCNVMVVLNTHWFIWHLLSWSRAGRDILLDDLCLDFEKHLGHAVLVAAHSWALHKRDLCTGMHELAHVCSTCTMPVRKGLSK